MHIFEPRSSLANILLLDHGITCGSHPPLGAYLLMSPFAAMCTNTGINCKLFASKILFIDTVAIALFQKASLAQ
jgi:hypothetical protein